MLCVLTKQLCPFYTRERWDPDELFVCEQAEYIMSGYKALRAMISCLKNFVDSADLSHRHMIISRRDHCISLFDMLQEKKDFLVMKFLTKLEWRD